MRLRGIHYDIGTRTLDGRSTRPRLTLPMIDSELRDIALGLHANAVRVTGSDLDRLEIAALAAADLGLEAWLSPMLPDADAAATLAAIDEAARVAERMRTKDQGPVLLVGCELSTFMTGILPGADAASRFALLGDPERIASEVTAKGLDPQASFDDFLAEAAGTARARFHGRISYAAATWEDVDWSAFDLVGIDAYRGATNRPAYADGLRALVDRGRPVVITEVGCATHAGAADRGSLGWTVVDRDASPRRLRRGIVRDEDAQAAELADILGVVDATGVDGAFVYTYVAPSYPSNDDPALDLDAASFALVRSWPDGRTERKAAYGAVAAAYATLAARRAVTPASRAARA